MKTLKFMIAAFAVLALASCEKNSNGESGTVNPDLNGTDAMIATAGEHWRSARQDWEWSEAFLFGPAGDYGLDPHTDTWPFDRVQFDKYMKKYSPATDEDDAAIMANNIATGQNLTGFHAVEYLIFREGKSRKIADMTANEVWFAQTAAQDLYLSSLKLVSAWGGDVSDAEQALLDEVEFESDDYGADFKNAGNAGSRYSSVTLATRQIIAGANSIIGEVRDSKIGAPATGEDVNYIESPHAHNSIQDFYDNIMSCKHALYGGFDQNGKTPDAASLIGVCLNIQQTKAAAEDVQAKLEAALDAISKMKKPFVKYYSHASAKTAMSALDDLEGSLDKLDGILEGYSSNAIIETKFKSVNEQFVEKTVKPTYRALADNDLKLVNALKKITW